MKLPSFKTWLVLAIASIIAVIPFLPQFRGGSSPLQLTYEVVSETGGIAQLYWDQGPGIVERNSSRYAFGPGNATVNLSIPEGRHAYLRLDPIDRPGSLKISRIRVVDATGWTRAEIAPREVNAGPEIASLSIKDDRIEISTTPGSADSQLKIVPAQPIVVTVGLWVWPLYSTIVFLVLAAATLALRRFRATWRQDVSSALAGMQERPAKLIAIVALASTVAATWPVVFLGHSFVSPNNEGAPLLYERWPTLPGYRDFQIYSQRGTDVGAIFWQHIPYSILHGDALAEGQLPLWNRYNSCGTTMLGQGQSMFGDPFLLPVMAARGTSWAWDLKFLFSRWLLCVSIGGCAWLLTRRAGPTLLVTFASAWLGFFLYRLNHPAIFSFCYAPGVLFSWMLLSEATTRHAQLKAAALLLFTSICLLCSGTVKEAYMLFFTMHFSGACVCLLGTDSWAAKRSRLLWASAAGLIFALVTSPVWLVFFFQLKSAYTAYNFAQAAQIQPGMLLGFFDELFYRPLNRFLWVFNPSANWLFLIGAAFLVVYLRDAIAQPKVRALLIAAVPPILLVFGVVPKEWITKIPFLANVVHIDNSFSCGLIILLAILSAWAFARAADRLRTAEGRRDAVVVTLAMLVPVVMWIGFCQAVHRSVYGEGVTFAPISFKGGELVFEPFIWWSLAAMIAASVAAIFTAQNAFARGRASGAQLALLALCGAVLLWRNGVHPHSTGFSLFTNQLAERVDFYARSKAVETVQSTQQKEPTRAFGLKANLFPGWTAFLHIEGVAGPDALINPYYRELVGASPVRRIWDWRMEVTPPEMTKARPFLDFLNVRYYLDLASDQALLGSVLKPVRMGDLDVYESPSHWPRAFFTNRVMPYGQVAELIRAIEQNDGRPFAAVQVSDLNAKDYQEAKRLLTSDLPSRRVEAASEYELTTNGTAFSIDAPSAGLAVLTEVWHRHDFRATIDGREAPVLRVNHAFRGVVIPSAGRHRIEVWYSPRGYHESLIMAAAGLVLLGAGIVLYRRSPA